MGHQKQPIRLTIAIGSLDRGGTERHLLQVLPRLLKYGLAVEVFCFSHRGVLAGDFERLGVQVRGLEKRPSYIFGSPSLIVFLAAAIRFAAYLLRHRPHIVHFFLPVSYIFGTPVAIVTRCYIRIMSRRNQNNYQRNSVWIRFIEQAWHRRMSAVLGNSKNVVAQLAEEGVDSSRLNLIYNGIDFSPFHNALPSGPARKRLGLSEDALVFVIVANLIRYKGHADLLHALARIKGQLPQNWVLLCAGRDDGVGPELQNMVQDLGLTGRIHWMGSVEDIPALLATADIALLTSHEEGFSNAIIEYMATGLPAIVTDVGGNAEAIAHNEVGLVVPSRDPVALSEAILRLAHDPALRRRFGLAAQALAQSRYSLEACVENYMALYRRLLKAHGIDV